MRIFKTVMSLLVSLGIMIVIFMLSAQNSGESGALSEKVARMLARVFVSGFDVMSFGDQAAIITSWSLPVRKLAHGTEYACLAISWFVSCWQLHSLAFEQKGRALDPERALPRAMIAALAISVAYACTDEIHQLFIDGRAGQIADVLVDGTGALVGCLLCYLCVRIAMKARS